MEVVAFDGGSGLLEADVVESGEGGAADVFDGVIRDEEVLLPTHEDEIRLIECLIIECVRIKGLGILIKGHKLAPMFLIHIFIGIPLSGEEGVLPADDFAVEEGRQRGELFRQTLDL